MQCLACVAINKTAYGLLYNIINLKKESLSLSLGKKWACSALDVVDVGAALCTLKCRAHACRSLAVPRRRMWAAAASGAEAEAETVCDMLSNSLCDKFQHMLPHSVPASRLHN